MNNTSVSATLIAGTRGVKDTQKDMTKQNPWNQLTWTHRAHGEGALMAMSELEPLHKHYGCVPRSSCGTLSSGSRDCPWLFWLVLGPSSSYPVASSSLMWGDVLSLSQADIQSLVDIHRRPALFWSSEELMGGEREGLARGGRGSCNWDVIHERIIKSTTPFETHRRCLYVTPRLRFF